MPGMTGLEPHEIEEGVRTNGQVQPGLLPVLFPYQHVVFGTSLTRSFFYY